ncbi:CopD family protein [Ammoniphilus sp. YIM 78166]|uniref:copper resistance CopC/CopD family protein n=1 Tax=Ammoniphilus sp. YIM 78166 TaxID=1644106 RepID=UPI00106F0AFB|nr:CopD family protein [Ammoniphilus sp. YIM 78166]
MKRVYIYLLILGLWGAFLVPQEALAHAYPSKSIPAQESKLQQSPPEIRVQFSEKIDTNLSHMTLRDAKGNVIPTEKLSEDGLWLILKNPPLEPGVYTVHWQTLSLDTHTTEGRFRFSVGGAELETSKPSATPVLGGSPPPADPAPIVTPAPAAPAPTAPQADSKPAQVPPSPPPAPAQSKPVAEKKEEQVKPSPVQEIKTVEVPRQEVHTTVSVEESAPAIDNAVEEFQLAEETVVEETNSLPPAEVSTEQPHEHLVDTHVHSEAEHAGMNTQRFLRIMELVIVVSVGGFLFFTRWILRAQSHATKGERNLLLAGVFLLVAAGVGDVWNLIVRLGQGWDSLPIILTSTWLGIASWLRPLLLFLLFFFLKRQLVSFFLISVLSLTFPLTGHAISGQGAITAVPAHLIHMMAVMVWFGGLIGLAGYSFLQDGTKESLLQLHQGMERFSRYAAGMMVIVTISGIFLTILRVDSFHMLFTSNYGIQLLWKLAFFLPVLGIAAIHRWYFFPRITALSTNAHQGLVWGLRLELILAILVLICAGLLSTTSPPLG